MKVRFENFLREKCEVCDKPAKWKYYENALFESYVADESEAHYYCDKCNQKKYEDKKNETRRT